MSYQERMAAKRETAAALLEAFPGSEIEPDPLSGAPDSIDYLSAARAYLAMGWSVVRADPTTKFPLGTAWKRYQTERPTDAQLVEWFGPEANPKGLAILTDSLVIIDADGEQGIANARALGAEDCPTRTIRTPRGGRHYYYTHPGGVVSSVNSGIGNRS